jgi:SAM-dependent methyltransferase
MAAQLGTADSSAWPGHAGLTSKACVQADIEAAWFSYWSHRLAATPVYHRKLWEFCYILQALGEAGVLEPGRSGLGFGCGEEPLPSLFAAMGVTVLATDAPGDIGATLVWTDTGQYSASIEALHKPDICNRETLERFVSLRHVDMNQIPEDLSAQFDFTWSSCAFEHLGSIAKGLAFVENSVRCLKPGGVAVHTTEWNYAPSGEPVDNCGTVLFRREHLEALAKRLMTDGYDVAPLDFGVGNGVLDQFIDLPPYSRQLAEPFHSVLDDAQVNLRLMVGDQVTTSFGLIIRAPA